MKKERHEYVELNRSPYWYGFKTRTRRKRKVMEESNRTNYLASMDFNPELVRKRRREVMEE